MASDAEPAGTPDAAVPAGTPGAAVPAGAPGQLAWLFAGHGVQYVGMGRAVLRDTAPGRAWLAAAEQASGLALGALAEHGPADRLTDPAVLEPLLAAISGAHADRLRAIEGPPDAVAAYSAGHVAALYAADAIDRDTCLRIAVIRGAALARAAASIAGGLLSAYGLAEDRLAALAADDPDEPAHLAARNAPRHVTYAGSPPALARAAARVQAAGGAVSPIAAAGPWHSPLLETARHAIAAGIADLPMARARRPVWSSVTAQPATAPEALRHALAASVVLTAQWHRTVQAMLAAGIDGFVEVSPGRQLWALLGQITPPHAISRSYVECPRAARREPTLTA